MTDGLVDASLLDERLAAEAGHRPGRDAPSPAGPSLVAARGRPAAPSSSASPASGSTSTASRRAGSRTARSRSPPAAPPWWTATATWRSASRPATAGPSAIGDPARAGHAARRPRPRRGRRRRARVGDRDLRHQRPPLAARGRRRPPPHRPANAATRRDGRDPGDGAGRHGARRRGLRQDGRDRRHRPRVRPPRPPRRPRGPPPHRARRAPRNSRDGAMAAVKFRGLDPRTGMARWGLAAVAIGIVVGRHRARGRPRPRDGRGRRTRQSLVWLFERVFAWLAYIAVAGSVIYGLLLSTKLLDAIAHRPISFSLHQDLAAIGLGLAAHPRDAAGAGPLGPVHPRPDPRARPRARTRRWPSPSARSPCT